MDKEITILQTCAGGIAMNSLTAAFKEAGAKVIAADMDLSFFSSGEKLPLPAEKKEYITAIRRIVSDYGYKNIVIYPHNDDEAKIISEMACHGACRAAISAPVAIYHTLDKLLLYKTCKELFPAYFSFYSAFAYQLFNDAFFEENKKIYKPRIGCGGKGILQTEGLSLRQEYICCDKLVGKEYTLDLLCNYGKIIDFCCRERIKSHGGICVDAQIITGGNCNFSDVDESLKVPVFASAKKIVEHFCLHGPIAMQGFAQIYINKDKESSFFVTDLNHRFGGGVGLSLYAGWRGVENYVRGLCGETVMEPYSISPARVRRVYAEEIIEDVGC